MPFCPNCRFEYIAGLEVCPDCESVLVAELPPVQRPVGDGFVQEALCTVTGELHAKLLQDLLASQGIPSRTVPTWPFDPGHSVFRLPAPIGGGLDTPLRVMVNRRDLARAQAIHYDFEERPQPPPDDTGDPGA